MKVVFLPQARQDLKWWRLYYKRVFPAGGTNAADHFDKSLQLILTNPFAGEGIEDTTLRRVPISRTPFILVYRVENNELKIARVWDTRQQPRPGFQEEQARIT